MTDAATPPAAPRSGRAHRDRQSGRFASLVGAGILISRITGLVRELVLRATFGVNNPVADAFSAALQLPKVLQNLLGEGSLSASFVPVYAAALEEAGAEEGEARAAAEDEAERLRGAVFGLLATAVAILVTVVVLFARPLSQVVLLGFGDGAKLDLTIRLTRLMAVGIGFIVMAAWCLGVLNAHRRFFLSYVAPVIWNLTIIGALLFAAAGDRLDEDVAWFGAIGVAVGGALQFAVQMPTVLRVAGRLRPSVQLIPAARTVLRRFVPAVLGRGVVTLSTYVDLAVASFLATGAITALATAQTLYLLPISVFAMGVAAADLPELAREQGAVSVARERVETGAERILFFLLFSSVAFIATGRLIVGALFQWVNFDRDDTIAVWLVLAAYSIGLVPSGLSRLLQNASYAAGDVKGPARLAALRAGLSVVVGVALMFSFERIGVAGGEFIDGGDLPAFSPLPQVERSASDFIRLGAVGLALGAMVGAWAEYGLLRRRLEPTYGDLSVRADAVRLAPGAIIAGSIGGSFAILLDDVPRLIAAPLALVITGAVYVAVGHVRDSPTATTLVSMVRRRVRR